VGRVGSQLQRDQYVLNWAGARLKLGLAHVYYLSYPSRVILSPGVFEIWASIGSLKLGIIAPLVPVVYHNYFSLLMV
jgi:hypothetical protein